jgi:hypothetical protein
MVALDRLCTPMFSQNGAGLGHCNLEGDQASCGEGDGLPTAILCRLRTENGFEIRYVLCWSIENHEIGQATFAATAEHRVLRGDLFSAAMIC